MSNWYVYAKKADFKHISEKFGIDQVVARILRNRDITGDEEIEYFLHGGIAELYDGLLMPDMQRAAEAVYEAVRTREHIRIVGDYDIDGVCGALPAAQSFSSFSFSRCVSMHCQKPS